MYTQYDDIFAAFKDKICDPDLCLLSDDTQTEYLTSIMLKALSRCADVYSPLRNDALSRFDEELPERVKDIITEWMTVFWLEPYVNNAENLRNAMSSKDFSVFSPANLLEKVCERYNTAKKDAKSLTNEYSYIINDLGKLKS